MEANSLGSRGASPGFINGFNIVNVAREAGSMIVCTTDGRAYFIKQSKAYTAA